MAKPAAPRKGRKKAAASRPAARGRGPAKPKPAQEPLEEAVRRTSRRSAAAKATKRAPGAAVRKAPRKSAAAKAAEEFVRGVLARGEASKAGRRGKLPPGATHEIVGEAQAGLPKLRRRRFSLA